jgi:lipopolysaccharide biosynthesis glycosyltransferase
MHQTRKTFDEPIVIVTACDDNYVRGAAAAVRSAIDSLPTKSQVRVFVLDGGIQESSKEKLLRSWRRDRCEVAWLCPDAGLIQGLPVSEYINLSTYLRLLMAELLPAEIDRAIYLDADTIVVRCLNELWSVRLEGAYCAAVQDVFHPVLDPALALERPTHSMICPNVDPRPISNYRELGLSFDAPYFNAGMMLANIERWRQEQIGRRALACLRDNEGSVRYWDQYALNVLFSGQWKILDPRWNQNSQVFRLPDWKLSHYSEGEYNQVRTDPWIVHFDYRPKPWDLESTHPFRTLFFKHLDRTEWRGWRPQRTLWQQAERAVQMPLALYQCYRKWRQTRVSPTVRAWKARLLGQKRRAA